MSPTARISFIRFGLLAPLLGFIACASNDSAPHADAHTSDLPQGTAGTLASAGSGGSLGVAGKSASSGAGANHIGGSFAQGGSLEAGSGGSQANSNASGMSNAGASGSSGGSGSASTAGATSGANSGGSAGAAGGSAAFAKVASVLGSNCGIKGCHADKESPHFVPGPMFHAALTGPNTVLAECGYTKLVEAGDPAKSALVRLMNRQCDGFTMPPSCNKTPCLAAADMKALSDWIQAGAPP